MKAAATAQKPRREYPKDGDSRRKRQQKERRLAAINGQPSEGRTAKAWGRYALQKRGGKSCPIDIRQKINAATFILWRALCLQSFIVKDQKKRGNLLNLRTRTLPGVNEKYDALFKQWKEINDELQLRPKQHSKIPTLKEVLAEEEAGEWRER
jgi:hypothetical protein